MWYLLFLLFILNVFEFLKKIAPFFKIAANEGHQEVVKILASNGADINHKNNNGSTALMCGIWYFNYFFSMFLILSNNC